jgi:hypothetical protein
MAFTEKTLTLVAHGSGNQVFQYVTDDNLAAVETAGYFTTELLKKGDVILASLDMDGTPKLVIYLVSAVSSGVATITQNTVTACESNT